MTEITDPVRALALTVFGEASDQGYNGMQAVANTVVNRAKNPCWWGDDILSVCLAKDQYDCWLPGPDNTRMLDTPVNDPVYQQALLLAKMAVAGVLPDITAGADSYYAETIPEPEWAKAEGVTFTKQIGAQRFYITRRHEEPAAATVPAAPTPAVEIEAPIPIPLPSEPQE
jgi:spore germination cell wall hydrolase CwlJ-like protein